MTVREKLIELLRVPIYPHELADPAEVVADYLLDNGLIFATDNNVGSKWIPVTERLPEQGQAVVVYDGGVLEPTVYAYHFWNKDYDSWARVTHWMPLPEPPKEVQNNA